MSLKNGSSSKGSAGSASRLKFTHPPMSREELLATGEKAALLLNSQVFNLAHRSVIQDLQDQVLQTAPHEMQKREWLYTQMQALGTVSQALAVMVYQAQNVNQERLAEDERNQQHHDEMAGF